MLQRLRRRTPLLRIQVQASIQKINERIQFLDLHIIHPLRIDHEPRSQISRRFCEIQDANDILRNKSASVSQYGDGKLGETLPSQSTYPFPHS